MSYTYLESPTVHAVIDTPIALRAARLQLVVKELEYCASLAEELLPMAGRELLAASGLQGRIPTYDPTDREHLVRRAFYTALVVTYGKVFAEVTSGGRSSLDKRKVFKGDGEKFLAFHEWVIENRRNSFVAHAGATDFESTRTVLLLPLPYSFEPWHVVTHHATFSMGPQYEEVMNFHALVYFVLAYAQAQVNKINQRILVTVGAESRGEQYRIAHAHTPIARPAVPPSVEY